MKRKINLILIVLFVLSSILSAQTKNIQAVKKESSITYQLTHPLHEIESTSKETYCAIDVDLKSREIKKVSVQVDVTTFNSGNSNRDSHAMEVIDALSFPEATFVSTSIVPKGNSLIVGGKLTFHGVTNDVTATAIPEWGNDKLVVHATMPISLTAFKVERPSLLFIPVHDTLRFTLTAAFPLK